MSNLDVFDKNSWGKKQIKERFGLDIVKANISTIDAADALLHKLCADVGFGPAIGVIDAIIANARSIQSTYGYVGYMNMLRTVWEENALPFEHDSGSNEFKYMVRLINRMKKQCAEGTVIGKKSVVESVLRNGLELLDHV